MIVTVLGLAKVVGDVFTETGPQEGGGDGNGDASTQTSRQAVHDLQDLLEILTLLALEIQGVSFLKMLTPQRAGFARNCF